MVQPERRVTKVNRFVEFLYNPIVWVVILTFLGSVFTLTITSLYITPLKADIKEDINNTKIALEKEISRVEKKDDLEHLRLKNQVAWNLSEIQAHKQWCDVTLSKYLDERPTDRELLLMIEPIREDICGLKKMQEDTSKEFKQSLDELKKLLIKKLN